MHIFQAISFSFVSFSFSAKEKEMVGTNGLEPSTSRLSGVRSNHLSYAPIMLYITALKLFVLPSSLGGDEENRTPDPLLAKQVLSQLSYTPICRD